MLTVSPERIFCSYNIELIRTVGRAALLVNGGRVMGDPVRLGSGLQGLLGFVGAALAGAYWRQGV